MNKTPIDLLTKVERVAAPPFLFTRIQARLHEAELSHIGFRKLIPIACCIAVLCYLNVAAIQSSNSAISEATMVHADFGMNDSQFIYR